MRKRLLSIVTLSFVAMLTLAACGTEEEQAKDVTRVPVIPVTFVAAASPAGEVAQAGATAAPATTGTEVTITLGQPVEMAFDPSELTIPANTDVAVSLPNHGAAPHNFSVDDLGISVDVNPGEAGSTTIKAAPGDYEFHCNIPGHKEAGMHGVLHVVEGGGAAVAQASPSAAATQASPTVAASPAVASPTAATPGPSPVTSPTTAETPAVAGVTGDVTKGQSLAIQCLGCHSPEGATLVGPTWKGLYGSEVKLTSGETVTADAAYLTESIKDPNAKVVEGFPANVMPPYSYLSDEAVADLVAYIESLK